MKAKEKTRATIRYIEGLEGVLAGPKGRPFFRVRLNLKQISELIDALEQCARQDGRCWFTLTSTHDKPARLRLMQPATPDYELGASAVYMRGEAAWISGDEGSCNINFSGSDGALMLIKRLRDVQKKMRRFVDIRIPSRARNLIEFVADVDLEAAPSAEHERLAIGGGIVASQSLPADDFGDWE